jgi:hypothetical protein
MIGMYIPANSTIMPNIWYISGWCMISEYVIMLAQVHFKIGVRLLPPR